MGRALGTENVQRHMVHVPQQDSEFVEMHDRNPGLGRQRS